jgi:endonuclease III
MPDLFDSEPAVDWNRAFVPLIAKYEGRRHPLAYQNLYQLLVMVLLSAQDSDRHINELAPELFRAFPTMAKLAEASEGELHALLNTVRNYENKTGWLMRLAPMVGSDEAIPQTLAALIKLPGIGRKSANVILRESKRPAEGVIVDLHVVRVAPRLGIATGENPEKIEKRLMEVLDRGTWAEAGMAVSFLGREICRPTNPNCRVCPMNQVCAYNTSRAN